MTLSYNRDALRPSNALGRGQPALAFVWNYAGIKVNLYCSGRVKSALGSVSGRRG